MRISSGLESAAPSLFHRVKGLTLRQMAAYMGLFGLVFIVVTFAYVALAQRSQLTEDARNDARSAAFFLADHAARFFEVADLALQRVAATTKHLGWDEIEHSQELWSGLKEISDTLPYVEDLWLNDSTGKLRLTTVTYPAPGSNVADRDAFRAHLTPNDQIFVGEPIVGRVTARPTFLISRRLENEDGSFRGIVSATAALAYFSDLWRRSQLPEGARVTLFRAMDRVVLAQHPAPDQGVQFEPVAENIATAIATSPASGSYSASLNGRGKQFVSYQKIDALPLYIEVTVPQSRIVARWLRGIRIYAAFALVALIALTALTWIAFHQAGSQVKSQARLEQEVERRTAALRAETEALGILNRTGAMLSGELDLDTIVQSVTDAGVALTGAQFGAFFYNVVNDEGEGYTLYALSGVPKEAFEKFPMPRKTEVFGPTFRGEGTIRSDDITEDPRYGRNEPYRGMPEGHLPVRSYLAVPVVSRSGEVHGALFFGHEKAAVFTERAEQLIRGIAAQAAIAIDNSRLFKAAQHEIDERKQTESRQSLLIRELHHRVKNTLATVQALVGATARSASSIDEFYEAFSGRIVSLAKTHTMLTEDYWQTASLRDMLVNELGPYDEDASRVVLDGPPVELSADLAVPTGMAIHELTTNAVKYGSLSEPGGKLEVRWEVRQRDGRRRLYLQWVERDGPPVGPPGHGGFGTTLLRRVLTQQCQAEIQIDYDPAGLRFQLDAPIVERRLVPEY